MIDLFFANLPWPGLLLGFVLSLAVSALGFRRVDWFISLGYGFSITAQAVAFLIIYRASLTPFLVVQLLLLLAYGLRLGFYLMARERSPSFARELEASRERSRHIRGGLKLVIWISVSVLYVAMASPGLFSLSAAASGVSLPSVPVGIVVMIAGLVLEATADAQKARLKAQNPRAFVSTKLFAIVRCPNYLGEMIFWLGAFASGVSAYASLADWFVAGIGLVCIELIMLGSARRLEIKQAERYDSDPAYQSYVRRVPILFPLLPLYSLRNLRIYLG